MAKAGSHHTMPIKAGLNSPSQPMSFRARNADSRVMGRLQKEAYTIREQQPRPGDRHLTRTRANMTPSGRNENGNLTILGLILFIKYPPKNS